MNSESDKFDVERYRGNCPCKRVQCERHGNCEECLRHHHLPGKKLATACERHYAKEERAKSNK